VKTLLRIALIATLVSCATGNAIKDGAKAGGKIALNCAEEGITSKASQIVPAILAILMSPSDTWKDQADMYAAKYTKDVTICAARTALDKLTAPVQSEALASDPEAVKRTATARVRSLEIEANVQ
jgi:hypothetical protein